jgi:hypothetical protein
MPSKDKLKRALSAQVCAKNLFAYAMIEMKTSIELVNDGL